MRDFRITWGKIAFIATALATLLAFINNFSISLALFGRFNDLYNKISLEKAKTFNLKGFILYRPLQDSHDDKHTWFLVDREKDNDIDSIAEGDYLLAATDTYLRKEATTKSRAIFLISSRQCVIIIHEPEKNNSSKIEPSYYYYSIKIKDKYETYKDSKDQIVKHYNDKDKDNFLKDHKDMKAILVKKGLWVEVALTNCPTSAPN